MQWALRGSARPAAPGSAAPGPGALALGALALEVAALEAPVVSAAEAEASVVVPASALVEARHPAEPCSVLPRSSAPPPAQIRCYARFRIRRCRVRCASSPAHAPRRE